METDELLLWIETHSSSLGGILIDWTNIVFILVVSMIIFITKGYLTYDDEIYRAKKIHAEKQLFNYHLERTLFCISVMCITAYLMIVLTGNAPNIPLNYIIIPFFSFITTLFINAEAKTRKWMTFTNPVSGSNNQQKEKEMEAAPHNISVVVNNADNIVTDENNDHFYELHEITKEALDSKGTAYFLNFLRKNQQQLNDRLMRTEEHLEKQNETLDILRKDRIGEKAIEIEDLIYKSLEQGFVTPTQDKLIRRKYNLYHNVLGGNGLIKELYEQRYLGLKVFEDRRKQNIPLPEGMVDRRKKPSNN